MPCLVDGTNGLNLRCTTLCLSSFQQSVVGATSPISPIGHLLLWPTAFKVTTMMVMMSLDMPIIVIGDMSMLSPSLANGRLWGD